MKAVCIIALVICFLGMIAACEYDQGDGVPTCTKKNCDIHYFRDNWDPTCYWECTEEGKPAVLVRCDQKGYSPEKKECVEWKDWTWVEPCNPPTV